MKNTYMDATRIDKSFVENGFCQVSLGYRFSMTLLGEDGIIFYDDIEDESFYENRYFIQ